MENIMILLPETIYILRDLENQDLITDREQYSIYYKNLIYPYKEEYDIHIKSEYGMNMGDMWRIEQFPDNANEFPLAVSVYGYFGEKLAEKSCTVKIIKKTGCKGKKLLCIGDSMTQQAVYVEYVTDRIPQIKTVGTRSFGSVRHEGRGGWCCEHYFKEYDNKKQIGVSPFLFPKGIEAVSYYGNKNFYDVILRGETGKYWYRGFEAPELKSNMYYYDNGFVLNSSTPEKIENPEFEFSFLKYLKRYEIEVPDVVSILFGANEFQACSYEKLEEEKEKYMSYIDAMIKSIKQADENISVVVNLPCLGSDQYSWGRQLGCTSTAKQYEYCIKKVSQALIEKYDGRQNEKIFLCPMLLVCSPVTGFRKIASLENNHTDILVEHSSNWVHPCSVGYMQMGGALAGVVEHICQNT